MIELAQKEYYPDDTHEPMVGNAIWFFEEMTVGQLYEMILEELE